MTEPELGQENENRSSGIKRLIGTVDQDYFDIPDAKKLKHLKAKGQEEFHNRAVRVIDKNLFQESNDLNSDIEEIDERILKVQQYLHTIRYHASLNLYAYDKIQTSNPKGRSNNKSSLNHPTLKRHLGQQIPLVETLPTAQALSEKPQLTKKIIYKESCIENDNKNNNEEKPIQSKKLKESIDPVVVPEQSPTVITQRRRERFQKKMKIIVGNTYRYLKDDEDPDSSLRFKWKAYVRTTDTDTSVNNFISAVKFTLDKSYAPCDEVIVSETPFSLSRRGWGEFKMFLQIIFNDARNKPIHLIHPLTLSRFGDPLAFTGLWRLGKEQLYEIWLFDKDNEPSQVPLQNLASEQKEEISENSLLKKLKEQGIGSETLYKDDEGHITLSHSVKERETSSSDAPEMMMADVEKCNLKAPPRGIENKIPEVEFICSSSKEICQETIGSKNEKIEKEEKKSIGNQSSNDSLSVKPIPQKWKSTSVINKLLSRFDKTKKPENLFQIWVRQSDGRLIPCKVPKAMYDIALKRAVKNSPLNSSEGTVQSNVVNNVSNSSPVVRFVSVNKNLINGNTGGQLKLQPPQQQQQPHQEQQPALRTSGQLYTLPRQSSLNSPLNGTLKLKSFTLPSRASSQPINLLNLQKSSQPINLLNLQKIPPNNIRLNIPKNDPNSIKKNFNLKTKIIKLDGSSSKPVVLNRNTLPLKLSPKFLVNVNNKGCVQSLTVNSHLIKTDKLQQHSLPAGNKILLNSATKFDVTNKLLFNFSSKSQNNSASLLAYQLPQNPNNKMQHEKDPPAIKTESILVPTSSVPKKENGTTGETPEVTTKKSPQNLESNEENNEENEDSHHSSLSDWFADRKLLLRSRCKNCTSVEEVLVIYLKGIPLSIALSLNNINDFFSSLDDKAFQNLSEGKKRSIEFWRAREIWKELQFLNIKNWQSWNVVKIVSWSRKHRFTPFDHDFPNLGMKNEKKSEVAFTPFSDNDDEEMKAEEREGKANLNEYLEMDVDVEGVDEKKKPVFENTNLGNDKTVILAPPKMVEENNVVDEVLSKVRNRFKPEEIAPGIKMDIAKNILYKTTLSFMEDLIRSSYAVAASEEHKGKSCQETSTGNTGSKEVILEKEHVLEVLTGGRTGFKSLTRFGMGKKFIPWS